MSRAPAAGAVQKASADLVRNWGRLAEKWVLAEQRASEAFFSREFAPLVPRGRGGGGGIPEPVRQDPAPAGARMARPAVKACLGGGARLRQTPGARSTGLVRRGWGLEAWSGSHAQLLGRVPF